MATISSLVERAQIYKELIPLDCSMTICDDQGVVMKFLASQSKRSAMVHLASSATDIEKVAETL